MKKILSCIVIIFLSSTVHAQQITTETKSKEKTTTLFDYGEPLNTIEANFRNLFRNFPLFVSNSGQSLKLTSYKHLATIKSQKQIKLYLEKNTGIYQADGGIMFALGDDDVENNKIRLVFPSDHQPNKSKALSSEAVENIEKATNKINLGDEVYVVNLIADSTKYDFYVFVNPKTNAVLKEGNFLAFSIPLYYADFYSKRKRQ